MNRVSNKYWNSREDTKLKIEECMWKIQFNVHFVTLFIFVKSYFYHVYSEVSYLPKTILFHQLIKNQDKANKHFLQDGLGTIKTAKFLYSGCMCRQSILFKNSNA